MSVVCCRLVGALPCIRAVFASEHNFLEHCWPQWQRQKRGLSEPLIGIKYPSWEVTHIMSVHKSLAGLSASHTAPPPPPSPRAGKRNPTGSLEGRKGCRVWCQRGSGLDCLLPPLMWSPIECHPLQEAFPDHPGSWVWGGRGTGVPMFQSGLGRWTDCLERKKQAWGGEGHLRHVEVKCLSDI